MRKTLIAIAAVAASALTMSASASFITVAYWNFNDLDIPGTGSTNFPGDGNVPLSIDANFGNASLSLANWGGAVQNFAGSTINAMFGDPAGASLSLQQGSGGLSGNGTFIEVTVSGLGSGDLDKLEISYWTRKTGTGFNANQWSYSTDGVNFINFGPVIDPVDSAAGELASVLLSTSDVVTGDVIFRYTLDGATTAAGNNRIDNLRISIIPAPGAIALLGLAGLVGCRRRRDA